MTYIKNGLEPHGHVRVEVLTDPFGAQHGDFIVAGPGHGLVAVAVQAPTSQVPKFFLYVDMQPYDEPLPLTVLDGYSSRSKSFKNGVRLTGPSLSLPDWAGASPPVPAASPGETIAGLLPPPPRPAANSGTRNIVDPDI